MRCWVFIAVMLLGLLPGAQPRADEGMWTYDHFPATTVREGYGVSIDARWLDQLRNSSVRLSSGCSGALVSAAGLVVTNQHCVIACVQGASGAGHDYVAEGYLSRRREEERPCPGLQVQILESITDVTTSVDRSTQQSDGADLPRARRVAVARLETSACAKHNHALCEVVSLYGGSQFKLYRYRVYSDVRLVFSPEFGVSFFGGDLDNYNFPRYCLDSAFLRLYNDGRPAATPEHLQWRSTAPIPGETVFVSGHPGATSRLLTNAELEMQRDLFIPTRQLVRAELRGRLLQFAAGGAEQARVVTDTLFDVENKFKWFYGRGRALADNAFYATKQHEEAALRAAVAADPALTAATGDAWGEVARAVERYREIFLRHEFLEARAGAVSDLYHDAVFLVRAASERERPSGERLAEYADSRLPLLEKQLLDDREFYPQVEQIGLELWLMKASEYLSADSPEVHALLGGKAPPQLAAELVARTRLADPAVRAALWRGGRAAVEASEDPLIRLVRATDAAARAVRREYEQGVEGPIALATQRIARARYAIYGESVYPDATFSLRLTFGQVAGWREQGREIAPLTSFAGLYGRASGAGALTLPARWRAAAARIDPATPLNFVATFDTVNGNSGAPVVDAQGQLLGVAFDGNLHSLGGDYGYDGRSNRGIAVASVAITTALRQVYGLADLADELEDLPISRSRD